tara:strand:+ start:66 stop:494 length:429 start_codon:yes stop_codon:yes gene_type:complete
MSKVTKDDLFELRMHQLKDLVKKIKSKLSLNVTGENKEKLVNAIFTLHNGNKFNGKKLLSFDKSGHIQLPVGKNKPFERITGKPRKFKSTKKEIQGATRATLKKGELEKDMNDKNKKAMKNPTYQVLKPNKKAMKNPNYGLL